MEANKDMFEHYDELPKEVQVILDKYSEMDNNCDNCIELVIDLEEVGSMYTLTNVYSTNTLTVIPQPIIANVGARLINIPRETTPKTIFN